MEFVAGNVIPLWLRREHRNRSISHLHEITVTFDNSSEKRLEKRPTYLAENHGGYSGLKGNANK